ncbi:TonB-dependent receptor [Elizabethkingia meningoseptica]|uniref:TonB-dependent receptor n=3 Tax=Elizabethkingia TaxID=308865 RepID=A0A1V3U4V5_ELIME|nr:MULTISPECIES: TonB-dependent receptor [Elizabethkingia]AQX11242.1 TonB-dependent receptor [Elizabethkingia meningoseptica]MBG0512585.1 TonB-dependent receptor [Elizabethkingia meningoseptica]MDE5435187.1 TonB-dependent receptor [Elizabethkingia meningoseptica]MDE5450696.1 TonB-dependent receptor [Elizabethkingia meningoseptica]MDE5472173.1 TonB-dependent receptor [Elizabethkingia meningoseptica]
MSKYMIALLLLCSAVMSYAQKNFTVQGTVKDSDNHSLISHAKVSIGNTSVVSDAQGAFSLKLNEGDYAVVVTHPKFDEFKESLKVDKNLKLEINMEHRAEDIETVVLNVKHRTPGAMIVSSLDKDLITRNAASNLGNLLTNISGVNGLKTGNNIVKPIIHGMYGSRIAILNNGVKMAEQEWGIEHAPNIEIGNYQHIDVIKGASALKFGSDAIGGVVLLEPAIYPKKDTLEGSIILNGQSNGRGGGVNVNLLKLWKNGWAINTNGSYNKLGDLKAPDYGLMNTGLESSSFNFGIQKKNAHRGFSLDYYLTNQNIGILRASHIGSPQDFYEAMNAPRPIFERDFSYDIDNPRQVVEHHLVKLNAYNDFKNFGKLSLTYSFQYNHRQEYDIRRGDLNALPALDMELITNQVNINHLLTRGNWSLESGIDGTYQNNYSDPATKARRLIPNYDKYAAGIYSIFKYKFNPKWNAEASARYDFNRYDVYKWYDTSDWNNRYADLYPEFKVKESANRTLTHPILDYHNVSFNAGVEYKPSAAFNLKFNYSKVSRTPNIAELFSDGLHHSASVIEVGDMSLKNETGNQFNLLLESRLNVLQGLQISLNPYFFYTRNYINEVPTGVQNTIRGVFPVWSYQQIDAKMYGADLDINWKLTSNITYKGRASYLYGQDLTHDVPLILMAPANVSNTIEFVKPEWNNFYFSVNNRQVFRQNRYPYNPVYITLYDGQGEAYEATLDLSTPPKAYNLWGLQAGVDIYKNFSVGVTVNNLFNTNYKDYLNRLRFFSYEMGRNIILNLKYNF